MACTEIVAVVVIARSVLPSMGIWETEPLPSSMCRMTTSRCVLPSLIVLVHYYSVAGYEMPHLLRHKGHSAAVIESILRYAFQTIPPTETLSHSGFCSLIAWPIMCIPVQDSQWLISVANRSVVG